MHIHIWQFCSTVVSATQRAQFKVFKTYDVHSSLNKIAKNYLVIIQIIVWQPGGINELYKDKEWFKILICHMNIAILQMSSWAHCHYYEGHCSVYAMGAPIFSNFIVIYSFFPHMMDLKKFILSLTYITLYNQKFADLSAGELDWSFFLLALYPK